MIEAIIFDLDGTLMQTEALKAMSYAQAAVRLSPNSLTEDKVIEAFKDVVGLSRKEVAQKLMERFGLEKVARARMEEFKTPTPWQAFVQVRMGIYESLISDPEILRKYRCPYNVKLLKWSRQKGYRTGLATMSHYQQAIRILQILSLESDFNFIATVDDVDNGKPDPEIYTLVAKELMVTPAECLVIEDSPSGVKAALAAGMGCIVVTTDFSRKGVHESGLLADRWIVDSPSELQAIAERFIAKYGADYNVELDSLKAHAYDEFMSRIEKSIKNEIDLKKKDKTKERIIKVRMRLKKLIEEHTKKEFPYLFDNSKLEDLG